MPTREEHTTAAERFARENPEWTWHPTMERLMHVIGSYASRTGDGWSTYPQAWGTHHRNG